MNFEFYAIGRPIIYSIILFFQKSNFLGEKKTLLALLKNFKMFLKFLN